MRWLVSVGGVRMDVPNTRSSHLVSTPRGGGAAFGVTIPVVWLFLIVSGLPLVPFPDEVHFQFVLTRVQWLSFACGFGLVALIGWLDDYRGLSARFRLLVQCLGAFLILAAGIRWRALDFGFGPVNLPVAGSIGISLLWVVWNTNLYNFMDGIDGIAGLNGVVLAIAIAAIARILGFADIFLAAVVMVPCLVAFLCFNLPTAKIFMGDSGSLPLGFAFATMTMALHNRVPDVFSFWHGVLMIGPFFLDATYTLIRRMIRGEKFWAAHRDHIYQKLARRAGSHGKVAGIYSVIAACSAGSVVWMIWARVQR